MRLLIHDLSEDDFQTIFPEGTNNSTVISDDGRIHACIGCLGCLLKTPGKCSLMDDYANLPKLLSSSNEILIISRNVYGSVSPFIKNVIDRMVGYMKASIEIVGGETYFRLRYPGQIHLMVHFYATDNADAKQASQEYIALLANALCIKDYTVEFHDSPESLKEALE